MNFLYFISFFLPILLILIFISIYTNNHYLWQFKSLSILILGLILGWISWQTKALFDKYSEISSNLLKNKEYLDDLHLITRQFVLLFLGIGLVLIVIIVGLIILGK